MATDAVIVLERLRCIRENDGGTGHSEPYIWPTLLWIDDATLTTPDRVGVTAPGRDSARVVVKSDMRPGETADFPTSVGALSAQIGEGLRALILVVALWENDETPERAVTAGFEAFASELRAAVAQRLLPLSSSNPEEREQAIVDIRDQVNGRVESAITGALTAVETAEVLAGLLDLDDVVGADITTLAALPDPTAPRPLSLAFGVEQGGRLLFYRDQTQNGTGDVSSPAVIGLGGWQDFRFLFSGGNGIIYAVDRLVQEADRYEIEGRLEVQAPAQIAFSRSSLDFGLLGIGEVATRTLRISSGGVAPVTVTVAASPGGVFSWRALQATLPPAVGIDLEVEFSPLAAGTARGVLTVASNAQGSPHTIPLSGSGRREIPN